MLQLENSPHSSEDPAQPKMNEYFFLKLEIWWELPEGEIETPKEQMQLEKNGPNRLALHRVATNLQFVKYLVFVKCNEAKYAERKKVWMLSCVCTCVCMCMAEREFPCWLIDSHCPSIVKWQYCVVSPQNPTLISFLVSHPNYSKGQNQWGRMSHFIYSKLSLSVSRMWHTLSFLLRKWLRFVIQICIWVS